MSRKRVGPKQVPEIENCSALVKNENHTTVNIDINKASHLSSINDNIIINKASHLSSINDNIIINKASRLSSINDNIITVNDREMDRINGHGIMFHSYLDHSKSKRDLPVIERILEP